MPLRSSGTCCAVRGCTNNRTKLNQWLQQRCFQHGPKTKRECSCEKRYSFHRMPTDDESKRMWLKNLKLKRRPKTVYVCSFHFVDKKPTEDNPHPALWLGYDKPPENTITDVQQLVQIKEEQRPDVDWQDPEPVHIKEEEEEDWTSLQAEQLNRTITTEPVHIKKEEEEDWTSLQAEQLNRTITTDVNRFGFTANPLKSEDDEEKPFPQLYVYQMDDRELLTRSADPMKASAGGEDFTEIEITWDPDETDSCSSEVEEESEDEDEDEDEESDSQLSYSSDSGPTSEDSDSDWMESRASKSVVNTVINSFTFSDPGERFGTKQSLQRDLRSRSGRTSSTCLVNEERVSRKTAKRHRCGIWKNMPTFWGDHSYA